MEWDAVRGDTYWDDDGGRTWVWPAFSMKDLEAKVDHAQVSRDEPGSSIFTQICEILQHQAFKFTI